MKFVKKINKRGFGIIEAIIASFILMVIIAGGINYFTDNRTQSTKLANVGRCDTAVNFYLGHVKSLDNSLIVRTTVHGQNKLSPAPSSAQDPICPTNLSFGCDKSEFPLYNLGTDGSLEQTGGSFNVNLSQNIRGAFTWAANVYNSPDLRPSICSTGITFQNDGPYSPTVRPLGEMSRYLPTLVSHPGDVRRVIMRVQERGRACDNSISTARLQDSTSFVVQFDVVIGANANSEQVCSQDNTQDVAYTVVPSVPDPVPGLRILNGNDELVVPNSCTCVGAIWSEGLTCPEMFTIKVQSITGGSLRIPKGGALVCDQNGPSFSTGTQFNRYCGDLATFDVGFDILETPLVQFNTDVLTTLRWSNLNSGDNNTVSLRAINIVGQSTALVQSPVFHVRMPQCDPNRPCNDNTISDGCGGLCPVRLPTCDPNRPCGSTVDTCGGNTCPPQTAEPPCVACVCDPNRPCGSSLDTCGNDVCGPQTAEPPCVGPPPCVCDPNRPCGSSLDTCGNDVCGPQTAEPPCGAACVPSCDPSRPCGSTTDTCGGDSCEPQTDESVCGPGCVPACDPDRACGSTSDTCGGNTCPPQTAEPPCIAPPVGQPSGYTEFRYSISPQLGQSDCSAGGDGCEPGSQVVSGDDTTPPLCENGDAYENIIPITSDATTMCDCAPGAEYWWVCP